MWGHLRTEINMAVLAVDCMALTEVNINLQKLFSHHTVES
jgi:hypothetical protein